MSSQPQSEAINAEMMARRDLEEVRGAPYSDAEWTAVRARLLAFARLLRDWVQPGP